MSDKKPADSDEARTGKDAGKNREELVRKLKRVSKVQW